MRPDEPQAEGGKGFCALIHLFDKVLISLYCPWNMTVQAAVLVLQSNRAEEL